MKNRKVLYIHIGTGKTGTTSIQSFLSRNEVKLREGFDLNYAAAGRIGIAHGGLDLNQFRGGKCGLVVGTNLERLNTEILSSSINVHVVSDENFPGLSLDEVEVIRGVLDPSIKVIPVLYLRRQDYLTESWYAEEMKRPNHNEDVVNLSRRLSEAGIYDYLALASRWEKVFGGIVVRSFDNLMATSGVLVDFLGLVSGDENIIKIDDSSVRKNIKFTPYQTLLLKALKDKEIVIPPIKYLGIALPWFKNKGSIKYLIDYPVRSKILSDVYDSNRKLIDRFNLPNDFFKSDSLENELILKSSMVRKMDILVLTVIVVLINRFGFRR